MPDFGTRWKNPVLLEKGGQAQTYFVDDAKNQNGPRRVAKIVYNSKEDRKARFLQEIEVTESFDHPNVVRSLGRGETAKKKSPFLIMPYYEHGTLEKCFDKLGTPLERLRVFHAICEGVAYAHSKGLIHRDLKPANIFMADSGVPIVGDFGLCYRADEDRERRNTGTAEAVGARKYMPPEWREGRVDRPQSSGDIYSLGKILYWIFAGTEYDGHEDDHCSKERRIAERCRSELLERKSAMMADLRVDRWMLAFSLADDLVSRTLRSNPMDRIGDAVKIADLVH